MPRRTVHFSFTIPIVSDLTFQTKYFFLSMYILKELDKALYEAYTILITSGWHPVFFHQVVITENAQKRMMELNTLSFYSASFLCT